MLKAIHASEDREAANEKTLSVIKKLKHRANAAKKLEDSIHEMLSCYDFPNEHCRRIRTNNPLERSYVR